MIYSGILQPIQTTIAAMDTNFKQVEIGSNFTINKSSCPLAIIKLEDGDLKHHTVLNGQLHIIGLFFKEKGVEELTLDEMEKMIITMRENYPELNAYGQFQFFIDQNVFDVFGVQIPIIAPFGAYRLVYNLRQDLQTNS